MHAAWGMDIRDMWLPGHACLLGIAAPLMIMRSRQSLGTNASVLKCAAIVSSKTASAHKAMLAIPGVDCEAALHSQHISASAPNAAGGARSGSQLSARAIWQVERCAFQNANERNRTRAASPYGLERAAFHLLNSFGLELRHLMSEPIKLSWRQDETAAGRAKILSSKQGLLRALLGEMKSRSYVNSKREASC